MKLVLMYTLSTITLNCLLFIKNLLSNTQILHQNTYCGIFTFTNVIKKNLLPVLIILALIRFSVEFIKLKIVFKNNYEIENDIIFREHVLVQ